MALFQSKKQMFTFFSLLGRGRHWPRRGVWGCAALTTPFHTSPAVPKGPISSKRVSSQDPLLRKLGNFSLYSLNFSPKFSLSSPQIGKFSAHKPPNWGIFSSQAPLFRGKYQFTSPTLRKSRPHTPTWKKVECPSPSSGYAIPDAISLLAVVLLVTRKGGGRYGTLHMCDKKICEKGMHNAFRENKINHFCEKG